MRRWLGKSAVKDGSLTVSAPLILPSLSKVEVGGMNSVAVKCIDIIQNANCEGSSLSFH